MQSYTNAYKINLSHSLIKSEPEPKAVSSTSLHPNAYWGLTEQQQTQITGSTP